MLQTPLARLVRQPSVAGIELWEIRNRAFEAPMLTMDLKVAMIVRGVNRFRYRGVTSFVPSGETLAVQPGEIHSVGPAERFFDADVLFIDASAISTWLQGDTSAWHGGVSINTPITGNPDFRGRFRALCSALRNPDASQLLVEERVHAFSESFLRTYRVATISDKGEQRSSLDRARELIHDTYTESITLDCLAETAGLPRGRFLRAFRRQFGMPPHTYLTRLRIDHARRLIAAGVPISEASVSAGFFDQSHFHRHFVKAFGLTPGSYRPPR